MLKSKLTDHDPYTEAERERDRQARRDSDARLFNRKKARRSGQRYDKSMTRGHRHSYDRQVGSE